MSKLSIFSGSFSNIPLLIPAYYALDVFLYQVSFTTLIITLLVALALWVIVKRAYFSKLSNIPGPFINSISNLPLLINTFAGNYHLYTTKLHNDYNSSVVRVGYNQVSISDPSELRRILATHKFRKAPMYEQYEFMALSTFSSTNPEHNKIRRRQVGSVFTMSAMRTMEDTILDHGVHSLMRVWDRQISDSNGLVNYFYDFHALAFDVIGELGFGKSFNILATGNTSVIDNVTKNLMLVVAEGQFPFLRKMRWLWPSLAQAQQYVIDTANHAIAQRKAAIANNNSNNNNNRLSAHFIDILQKFVDACDPDSGALLDGKDLTAEIILLLVAGTDTTSNTLTWIIMHLMHNPEVYKKVKEEVRQRFPSHDTTIRYDEARQHLPYLRAVILESMRLTPAVNGFLPRVTPEGVDSTIMDRYKLPEATEICVSFAACHRNPRVWSNPDRFDPERFLGEDGESMAKNVLAFSTGVRVCIGRNLAWIELYTTLANIIRRYDFALPADAPYGPHRLSESGLPVEIPGAANITCEPRNPKANCLIQLSKVC